MKKKVLAISAAVLVLAILSMGSLAWFTDDDSAENVFEVGSIEILQHEKQHDETGALEDFEQNKVLMPIVNTTTPSDDPNYQEKIVTVESKGENPAYVRTFIAVPTNLLPVIELDFSDSVNWLDETVANQTVDIVETIGSGSTGRTVTVNYTVFTYTYVNAIGVGETQNTTDVLLEGVYMEAHTDCQENAAGVKQYCYMDGNTLTFCDFDIENTVKVLVATQAVQKEGFESVGASAALDAAFGADTHPIK